MITANGIFIFLFDLYNGSVFYFSLLIVDDNELYHDNIDRICAIFRISVIFSKTMTTTAKIIYGD